MNLHNLLTKCNAIGVSPTVVDLYSIHKEVMVSLPDRIILSLLEDTTGQAYDAFVEKHGIYYLNEYDLWGGF